MIKNRKLAKKRRNGWKILLFLFVLLLGSFFVAATFVSGTIKGFKVETLGQLLKETPKDKAKEKIKIFDAKNNLIDEFDSGENREYVALSKIKTITQQAFIAAEDERFYQHQGFDLRSILRAIVKNIVTGETLEGGSTITQQLARNVYLNSFEKTITRKIKELLLSVEIEKRYDKKQILEFYLNQVYFGSGAYGIEAASRTYFGKPVGKLDLAESAMLAGILTSPSTINPFSDPQKAFIAQESVLTKMNDNGFIKHWQKVQALEKKLVFSQPKKKAKPSSINYFIDYAKEELASIVGQSSFLKGGLDVYTTVDPTLQNYADQAVKTVLDRAEKNGDFGKVIVDKFGAKQPQAALVAIDVKTGWIRAMVGGRDYNTTQYNRTLSLRAPGSTFKVFVYSAAFAYGSLSPYSYIRSSPISFGGWSPTEWFRGYFGTITTQYAIQESSNICAIRAMLGAGRNYDEGMSNVSYYAKQMAGVGEIPFLGDREILAVPSMALGTVEMRPIEMASAGQTLGNLGNHLAPVGIRKIINRKKDAVIYNADTKSREKQVLKGTHAFDMIACLKRVVRYGTGKSANVPGIPCAGKTGTTTNFRDGWFMGFTPKISAAVYVGADSSETDLSFVQNYGSTYSAVIWKEFIRRIPHQNVKDWQEPDDKWVPVRICTETGLLCNSRCIGENRLFRAGNTPVSICQNPHNDIVEVTICTDSKKIASPFCTKKTVVKFDKKSMPKEFCQIHIKKVETLPKKEGITKKPGTTTDKNPPSTKPSTGNESQNPQQEDTTKPDAPPKDTGTKPQPKPDPKTQPKPEPKPQPQPDPEPEPEPEPQPPPQEEYKYFTIFPSKPTSNANEAIFFTFSHNYPYAARVEMYVNSVFVSSSGTEGPIYWKPTTATTYSIIFYLKDVNGQTLDSKTIQYTVYP
jgi:penicillin-binding protein 1A